MKIRFLSLLLVSALLITTGVAEAAVKAGTKCSKSGQVSGAFICVKVKGKLQWKQKVASAPVPSATAVPVVKPVKAPTPPEILFSQKVLEGLVSAPSREKLFSDYTITFEPILAGTIYERDYRASVEPSFALLDSLDLRPTRPVHIFVGWTKDWWLAKQREVNIADYPCVGGVCSWVEQPGPIYVFVFPRLLADAAKMTLDSKNYPSNLWEVGIRGDLPHELGHVGWVYAGFERYASATIPPIPAWLREGWAEYFKVLYFARVGGNSFEGAHKAYMQDSGGPGSSGGCLDVSLALVSSRSGEHPESKNCHYNNGFLALERLVYLLGGTDKIFKIAKGSTEQMKIRFEEAYGLNFDQFIEDADKYVRQEITDWRWW